MSTPYGQGQDPYGQQGWGQQTPQPTPQSGASPTYDQQGWQPQQPAPSGATPAAQPGWGQQAPAYDPASWGQQPVQADPTWQQAQPPYDQQATAYQGGYPQQYQQPGYGQAAYGQPLGQVPEQKSKTGLIVALLSIVLIGGLAAVALFLWPGFLVTKHFDQKKVEQGVVEVMKNDHKLHATGASCDGVKDVKLEAGATFKCEVTIDGKQQTVTMTVKDKDGTYEVPKPAGS